ncbi:hypothetical protein JQN72_07840 [Phycicoccus sp. CSK15P-2]|uniref:DUF6318 family protein n=1 Tax=Phycicoccus sp. CSK15P-2 TaxID=2807627 RepID=UPI0019503482|nr:DUF6318 family protein [Phycicoccus sp. CSK15P-2]MBM6404154.1 hypothetical protein [Phycicoccus sp. CSK15P-2]
MLLSGRVWLVGAAVVAVVVAAGCGGSGGSVPSGSPVVSSSGPGGSVSSSASPSVSGSPSSTGGAGPEVPAAAREQTPEGAEAFVEFYFEQFNVAWTEPRPGLIEANSTGDCKFCRTTEEHAVWLADNDQRYSSEPITLKSVEALAGAPKGQLYLFAEFVQNPVDVVTADGTVTSSEDRMDVQRNLALKWSGGRWYMFAVEVV